MAVSKCMPSTERRREGPSPGCSASVRRVASACLSRPFDCALTHLRASRQSARRAWTAGHPQAGPARQGHARHARTGPQYLAAQTPERHGLCSRMGVDAGPPSATQTGSRSLAGSATRAIRGPAPRLGCAGARTSTTASRRSVRQLAATRSEAARRSGHGSAESHGSACARDARRHMLAARSTVHAHAGPVVSPPRARTAAPRRPLGGRRARPRVESRRRPCQATEARRFGHGGGRPQRSSTDGATRQRSSPDSPRSRVGCARCAPLTAGRAV